MFSARLHYVLSIIVCIFSLKGSDYEDDVTVRTVTCCVKLALLSALLCCCGSLAPGLLICFSIHPWLCNLPLCVLRMVVKWVSQWVSDWVRLWVVEWTLVCSCVIWYWDLEARNRSSLTGIQPTLLQQRGLFLFHHGGGSACVQDDKPHPTIPKPQIHLLEIYN